MTTQSTRSPLQVGLLLCDDTDEADRDQYGTYSGMFRNALDPGSAEIRLTAIRCFQGEALPQPEEFDGYMISGSRYSVYDDLPWIKSLQRFVVDCREKNVRVVGICFGHQLIAHALGGRTEKAACGWGFGIQAANITDRKSWMNGSGRRPQPLDGDRYNLIVIHQDQVVEVPPGFETIAENDFCPNSMIVAGNKMLGIQGHPEFSKEFCAFRAEYRKELIGPEVYRQALRSLAQHDTDSAAVMQWISNFLRLERPAGNDKMTEQ